MTHGKGKQKSLLRKSNGQNNHMISTVVNVTDRKIAEDALRENEQKFRLIANNSIDAIWQMDLRLHFIYMSPSCLQITGFTPEEMIGKPLWKFTSWKAFAYMARKALNAITHYPEETKVLLESYMLKKNGEEVPVEIIGKLLMDHKGKLIGLQGSTRDITERKKAAQDLTHSHDLMRYIIEHNRSAIAIHDKDLRYIYVSQRYLDDFKLREKDIIGKHHYEVLPDIPQKWRDVHQKALAGEVLGAEDDPFTRSDGTTDWARWECRPWYEGNGSIGGIIIYTETITHRKLMENDLRESEEKYRRITENMSDVVWTTDLNFNTTYVSPSIERLVGETVDLHLSRPPEEKFPPDSLNEIRSILLEELEKEKSADMPPDRSRLIEAEHYRADGTIIWIGMNVSFMRDETGKPVGIQGVTRDITEKKLAENQIRLNSERLSRSLSIYQYNPSNTQDFLDYALNEAIELTSSKIGYIYFYNEEKQEFILNSWSKDVMKECKVANPMRCYELAKTGIWGEAVRQRKPIIINNFKEAHPLKKGYPSGHVELKKFLTIPIIEGNKIVAVIGMANKVSDYDESDAMQLELMMNSVWRIVKSREAKEYIIKLSKAIEQSPTSIIITDSNGEIEFVNKKFISFMQYTLDEVKGKKPRLFNPGHTRDVEFNEMWDTIRSGNVWQGEFKNKKKDGSIYWEHVIISPVTADNGSISNYILIMEDISEKKKMFNELLISKEKSEESNRLKTAFLNNISHEIRTPMNAIVGFSEILTNPILDPEKRKYFTDIIVRSSEQLLSIITNIIDISTIEAGQETLNEKETNINSLCKIIYEQFTINAKEKPITLNFKDHLNDSEAEIITDETKLIQVLSNLINNAFKFTKQGYINFGYNLIQDNLEFYVEDTGIGIPHDMHTIIFERFRQVETADNRKSGGSGLGLSISRAYVELLGGNIWLKSEPGKGTVFFFTLPYKKAKLNIIAKKQHTDELVSEKKKNKSILVAEDEDSNYMYINELLSPLNFNLIRAEDGLQAVEVCKTNPEIDIVLMDIKMPVMNGFEATKQILKLRPELPVIAQTAYSTDNEKYMAILSGCCAFISKPYSREELISAIKVHI